jgi:hypothetical protein
MDKAWHASGLRRKHRPGRVAVERFGCSASIGGIEWERLDGYEALLIVIQRQKSRVEQRNR